MIRTLPLEDLPGQFGLQLKLLKRPKPTLIWWAQADAQVRAACTGECHTLLGCGLVARHQSAHGWLTTRDQIDFLTPEQYASLMERPKHTPDEQLFVENVEIIHFTTIQSDRTVVGILSYLYGDLSRAKVYASSSAGATKVAKAISQIPSFTF
ncbi:MAG: hypothetical protein EOP83_23470 [Verrucomicrobiaceae bacterium]|nr:MAG: hypothetical protein EOP83_23470 [Verrucomicrobiaceae bacterium]